MKNDEHNVNLIKRNLHTLALKYDTDQVKIDKGVFNPGRLVKLPGTFTRKGENTSDRPHRRARILKMPKRAKKVSIAHLEALAASVSEPSKEERPSTVANFMDVNAYAKHYGVQIKKVKPYRGGRLYILKTCPFNENHSPNKASIFQSSEGKLYFRCFHNSCMDKKWEDTRSKISGNDNLDRFFKNLPKAGSEIVVPYSIMAGSELVQKKVKETPIIRGLLEKTGSLLIVGQTGGMKSMLTLNIALNLATPPQDGRLWGLFDIPKAVNTLFIQSENGIFGINNRLQLMIEGNKSFKEASHRIFFPYIRNDCRITGNLREERFQEILIDMIMKTKSRLLIVDPLISFHGESENGNTELRKVLDALTELCDVTKIASIVVHHSGKLPQDGPFAGRGASAISDWAANMLTVSIADKGTSKRITLKHVKSRNFRTQPPFTLEVTDDLQFTKVDSPEEENDNLVVEVLESLGGSVDNQGTFKKAVADKCKKSDSKALRLITAKVKAKEIETYKVGKKKGYRFPDMEKES